MTLDIDIEGWPASADWAGLAERASAAAAAVAPELANPRLTISVLFTSDDEVRALNRDWRSRDEPTNVLSFPMLARGDLLGLLTDGAPKMLGDIVLARDTCQREAIEKAISVEDHAAHLLVHGLLHLSGHDHVGDADADAMEALEIKALALMGIPDPYGNA